MENRHIAFSPPDITEEEIAEVVDALKSGWITTGPKTKRFEKELAEYMGTSKVACLNSATAAAELILRVLGVGEGDEVIIFGEDLPVTEMAKTLQTIPYEVFTGISPRVKRIYYQD